MAAPYGPKCALQSLHFTCHKVKLICGHLQNLRTVFASPAIFADCGIPTIAFIDPKNLILLHNINTMDIVRQKEKNVNLQSLQSTTLRQRSYVLPNGGKWAWQCIALESLTMDPLYPIRRPFRKILAWRLGVVSKGSYVVSLKCDFNLYCQLTRRGGGGGGEGRKENYNMLPLRCRPPASIPVARAPYLSRQGAENEGTWHYTKCDHYTDTNWLSKTS